MQKDEDNIKDIRLLAANYNAITGKNDKEIYAPAHRQHLYYYLKYNLVNNIIIEAHVMRICVCEWDVVHGIIEWFNGRFKHLHAESPNSEVCSVSFNRNEFSEKCNRHAYSQSSWA